MDKTPNTIRIGFFNYKITIKNLIVSTHSGQSLCGEIHNDTRELILLKENIESGDWRNTIFHEVIHGLSYQSDLELSEHQVEVLANGIEAFVLDNPSFISKLNKG